MPDIRIEDVTETLVIRRETRRVEAALAGQADADTNSPQKAR
jgi:hypothetical protein